MLEFRILGPLEVAAEDRPVALGGPRQRAVLAVLLLHRGQTISADRLIDDVWNGRPPATAAKTLQGYVSHLRKALGPEVVVTRGGGYVLEAGGEQVDSERFAALAGEARTLLGEGEPARARDLLERALGLWRGDALADLAYEPFATGAVAELDEARLAAREDLVDARLALGEHRALAGELEALVDAHPSRERLLGQLMLALYRSGRQADALEVYRRGRRALQDELGLEPGPELRALEQQILEQDATLAPPPAPARRHAPRARRGRMLLTAGGAVLLAAAAAAAVLGGRDRHAAEPAAPNSVAAIDARSNRVVAGVPVGARPGAIAYGSGSLWVANVDDRSVSRVDPRALRVLRTIPLRDPPTAVAATRSSVWVIGSGAGSASVSARRIDPRFDAIVRVVRVGNLVPGAPAAAAARADALWVAPFAGPLTRLAPDSGRVLRQLDPNASPAGLALGADTQWITDGNAGNVTRVDPTGLVRSVPVGHEPGGIAVGAGAVWVANRADDSVVRIDPATSAVVATIPVGRAPVAVAFGEGSVWVANSGDGTVARVDPATNRVASSIDLGGSPQGVVVAGGRAWVTVAARPIPDEGGPGGAGVLRSETGDDVRALDPPLAYGLTEAKVLYATCAKLLNYPDAAGAAGTQLVPEVAQALPVRSPDGRTYTFTIRPGFRFSPPSGEPVTARTFKATIERALNPRMHSPLAPEYADIQGARAFAAGRAAHISGVQARGDKLTIRLTAPAPDLLARLAVPAMCAVPPDTPVDPEGVRVIPSAGPYRIAAFTPGQAIVLVRNPAYRGRRPRRARRIEITLRVPDARAVRDVASGAADYTTASIARRGVRSLVNPLPQVDYLALNTHRAPFASARLRRAASLAIDRRALARLGDEYSPTPSRPTDHYLPPGMPGYRGDRLYPPRGDRARARAVAGPGPHGTAVLYTCDVSPCAQQAQIVKSNLAAIGLRVIVKSFPDATLYTKTLRPGEPFDMVNLGWVTDYRDPSGFLNVLLAKRAIIPPFADPVWRARLAAAARLTGPRRYLAYARLDRDLALRAAPLVAFGNISSRDYLSRRTGCPVFGVYGIDLGALCLR